MKRFNCKLLLAAALALCFSLSSCKDDEVKITPDSLPLSKNSLFFSPDSQEEKTIEVATAGNVSIAPGYDQWVIASAVGQTVKVQVSELGAESGRTAELTIISGNQSATLKVVQAGTEDLLKAERVDFTFMPLPMASKTIKIEGASDLEFDNKPSWLDITTNGNTVTFTAQDNDAVRERREDIIVYSGTKFVNISIAQRPNVAFEILYENTDMVAAAISPNGRYVCGQRSGFSFVWDIELDEKYYTAEGDLYGIANDGIAVGSYKKHALYDSEGKNLRIPDMAAIYDYRTNEWTVLEQDAVGNTDIYDHARTKSGCAWAVSPDGAMIVGNVTPPDYIHTSTTIVGNAPVYWQNTKSVALEYHDKDQLGQWAPQAYRVKAVSDDKSIMVGIQTDWTGYTEVVTYWNMADGKIHLFGEGNPEILDVNFIEWVVPGETYRADIKRINTDPTLSRNGKYIAATVYNAINPKEFWPAILDIQTGEYQLLSDLRLYEPAIVTDKGELIVVQGGRGGTQVGFWDGTEMLTLDMWLLTKHDYEIKNVELSQTMVPKAISSDGTRIAGFGDDMEAASAMNFVLYLPRNK